MDEEPNGGRRNERLWRKMSIGMAVGAGIGAAIGGVLENSEFGVGIGVAIGPGFGASIGLALSDRGRGDEGGRVRDLREPQDGTTPLSGDTYDRWGCKHGSRAARCASAGLDR